MASGPIRHDLTGVQEVIDELSKAKFDARGQAQHNLVTQRSVAPNISNTHSTKKPKTGLKVSSADSLPLAWTC